MLLAAYHAALLAEGRDASSVVRVLYVTSGTGEVT
jgi:hypothetical protein